MVTNEIWCALGFLFLCAKREAFNRHRLKQFYYRQKKQRVYFIVLVLALICQRYFVERRIWARPRSGDWWKRVVSDTFTDAEWKENFRMSKKTFKLLCNHLQKHIGRKDTRLRPAIAVEKRVAITLWRLATNCEYRTIGHLFGVACGTVCVIVNEVCQAIARNLTKKYIKIPRGRQLTDTVEKFESKFNFPQCFGAIDGSHIPIIAPTDCPKDYYNRKGFHSVLLQGIVNSSYCFSDIYIGWPGSVHDARMFCNSKAYKLGESGQLVPPSTKLINGVQVPLLILGDPAYPLLSWLMKPFSDNGKLSADQLMFNYCLSRARSVVENAFGRLKGRWRCLMKRNDMDLVNVINAIAACTVLHNMCEINKDIFDENWLPESESTTDIHNVGENTTASTSSATSAESIREALIRYMHDNPI